MVEVVVDVIDGERPVNLGLQVQYRILAGVPRHDGIGGPRLDEAAEAGRKRSADWNSYSGTVLATLTVALGSCDRHGDGIEHRHRGEGGDPSTSP